VTMVLDVQNTPASQRWFLNSLFLKYDAKM
jgi:hypothetical protein